MDIFWGLFAVIVYFSALYGGKALGKKLNEIGKGIMAKLDTLNTALAAIDSATTQLAANLEDLRVRVTNDDISDAELQAAVDNASALAARISDASAAVAGIEPTDVAVPPVEDPNDGGVPDDGGVITDPVVTDPVTEPPVEGTDPTQPTP